MDTPSIQIFSPKASGQNGGLGPRAPVTTLAAKDAGKTRV